MTSPPYGAPSGPDWGDDSQLLVHYLAGAVEGFSPRYHIEDRVLLLDRMEPAALSLGNDSYLIRGDGVGSELPAHLLDRGLLMVDPDPPLAAAVALQAVGLPAARWDLWGSDREEAWWRLEAAAENWWAQPHHRR